MGENRELRLSDVPPVDAEYWEISQFARRIDGYGVAGSLERCSTIAQDPDRDSIDELHIALFFHYRAMRHCGEEETDRDLEYVRGLVTRIRELLPSPTAEP